MSIQDDLYSILSNAAGVTALVGTRIYPGIAAQDAASPLIVYKHISGVNRNQLNGSKIATSHRIQIQSWAAKPSTARSVIDAVETALDGTGYIVFRVDDVYDPETREWSSQADWKRWK